MHIVCMGRVRTVCKEVWISLFSHIDDIDGRRHGGPIGTLSDG